MEHELEDHDRGLAFDLGTLIERRGVLSLVAGAGLMSLVGCGAAGSGTTTGGGTSASSTSSGTSSSTSGAGCAQIPEETAGPCPGDGSNGVDVLSQSGIVRADIRSSFGSSTTTAEGAPLAIALTVLDAGRDCAPLAGAAVYMWHCNRDGQYSLYSAGVTGENYLRGVQETDANGRVTFTSIFPACYSGRWPHIHYEVYPSVERATSADSKIATSQIALPRETCDLVYAADGYGASGQNLTQVSLDTDNVFRDGWTTELGTVTGGLSDGLTVSLTSPVSA